MLKFFACRHKQHQVAQCSTDLHKLWLEHPKGNLYCNSSLLEGGPKGSSTEIYKGRNDSQPLRVVSIILPTNGAATPPILCRARRVLRNRAST